jgi:hypothetical protein
MPRAKESIKKDREIFEARFGGGRLDPPAHAARDGDVQFKEPGFFAGSQERSTTSDGAGLADMFAQSFSLGRDEAAPAKRPKKHKNTSVNNPFSPQRMRPVAEVTEGQARGSRVFDAVFLTLLLGAWAYAMLYPSEHSPSILKAALAVATVLAIRVGVDTITDARSVGSLAPAAAAGMVLCAAELGSAAYIANKIWNDEGISKWGEPGLWTLGVMWGHQLWNAWC